MRYIITIDQRTSSSKALLFDEDFNLVDRKIVPHKKYHPKDGWAEVDAEEIYNNVLLAVSQLDIPADAELSVSLVNQRETSIIWDKNTGKPVYRAVLWQCHRGKKYCDELIEQGYETKIKESTGLFLDPYFSASSLRWVLDNVESVRERAENGNLLFGTMDTWLIWKLTKGKVHATDYTNASRTMLFNITDLEWDADLLKLFTIPPAMMPEAKPSDSIFGSTDFDGFLKAPVKIAGVAGNSHGALIGQGCLDSGMGKTTYGTGSSVMFNIGEQPVQAPNGMVCSVGYSLFDKTYYVLEGHSHASGVTIDWLIDNMHLADDKSELNELAKNAENNGGVYFVPAFSGLGSPWWLSDAKAMITGLTLSTKREHIVRAAFESVAYQVTDVVELVSRNLDTPLNVLCVDGDAARTDFLIQFQADMLGFPVRRLSLEEASGLGSAILNCCALGVFTTIEQVKNIRINRQVFNPVMKPEERNVYHQGWLHSVHTLILGTKR